MSLSSGLGVPCEQIAGSEVENCAPLERNWVGSHARAMQETQAGGDGVPYEQIAGSEVAPLERN